MGRILPLVLVLLPVASAVAAEAVMWQTPQGPLEVADHRKQEKLTILVFGDNGTGKGGQYRVGHAMYEVCRERGCDLALMLGDNIYEDGIVSTDMASAESSLQEIRGQFQQKFERAYREFESFSRFDFWAVLGNHDYRLNSPYSQVMYSWDSKLWRMPAYYYDIPFLPNWIQIIGVHTDTDRARDFNGLQVASARRALCREGNRWKIAFGHQPVYNHGHHSGDRNELRFRNLFEPVMKVCGVHVYLSGHAHHQEHISAPGFEQVIQGAAGRNKGSNRFKGSGPLKQRYFARDFGFGILEVTPERMQIDFYSVAGTKESMGHGSVPSAADIEKKHSCTLDKNEIGKPGSGDCVP